MNKTETKETTDYTAHKWKIEDGVEGYDLKATFYPNEECYLCLREYKEEADLSVYIGSNHYDYRLPSNIFRKVINEVISFVGFKNNVLIPKLKLEQ